MQQRSHVIQWPCIGAQAASAMPGVREPAARRAQANRFAHFM
jgi:hypothetical protein